MYGDAVLDEKLGFTILSGDQLVAYLAIKYNASKIVVGTDTDGIFDADPKTNPDAKPYKKLTLAELKAIQPKLGKAQGKDVTGGMAGKIAALIPAIEARSPCYCYGSHKRVIYLQSTNRPKCVRH